MKGEELRAAEAHIARLEEELLRLKDVKHDLQVLREEHRRLRRSAEGRVAKILSAPFRLFRRRQRTDATEQDEYGRWFARHRVSAEEAAKLCEQSRTFSYRPLLSILMPTFNPNDEFLTAAVESVIAQAYENWELILVDDGSSDSRAHALLKNLGQRDARIQIGVQEHGGISSALNTGLARARGDWIALLDHDDLLEPDALFRAIELMQNDREADMIYSDEDKIVDGKLAAPLLKPDWSPEFFRTHDYLGHFVVMRRDLARVEFRSEFNGAQDYDLLLRISEKTDRVRHIPRVLYHWRRTRRSTAHNIRRKPGALEAGRRAIEEHLHRRGLKGRVTIDWQTHTYRVRYDIAEERISVVRFGQREQRAAVEDGTYPNIELLDSDQLTGATGSWLLFMENSLEPFDATWLHLLAEQLANPEVGAVGARIIGADERIESAGYVLMPNGTAQPAFAGRNRK